MKYFTNERGARTLGGVGIMGKSAGAGVFLPPAAVAARPGPGVRGAEKNGSWGLTRVRRALYSKGNIVQETSHGMHRLTDFRVESASTFAGIFRPRLVGVGVNTVESGPKPVGAA